jgi:hypothetical protein
MNTSRAMTRFTAFAQTNHFKISNTAMNGFFETGHVIMTLQTGIISCITGSRNDWDDCWLSDKPFLGAASVK